MSTKLPIDKSPVNALDVSLLNTYPSDVPSFAVIPMKTNQHGDEQIANAQILRNVRTVGYLSGESTRPIFRVYPIRSADPGATTQDFLAHNQPSSLPTYDEVMRVNVTAEDIRSSSNPCGQRSTVWSTGLSNDRSNDRYFVA
uniref:MSP domain-containing protein n=1 Tax=Ascaris lumbricoides TaxID=6252 RepID=A0A0M3I4W2_ASCLU